MSKVLSITLIAAAMMVISANAWAGEASPKAMDLNVGPKTVIENTVNGIIGILKARKDTTKLTEEDRDSIRQTVEGRFDYREMSKRSLGKAWKGISEKEKESFSELFRKLLERSYGNRLASFHDQKVEFADAQFKKDKARVKSKVIDAEKETPVEYRLHQTATGWQVYDIKIEGVSLVSNFRKDFKASIKSQGGFEGLVQALEKKVQKLEAKDRA
ncbi:MAG: ABC transporter substrate-binding protein [Mariprofundaceae bacterium]